MKGIQSYIDLTWTSTDHIIRVEWVFSIGGKNMQLTYGLGKFGVAYSYSYWPFPAVYPNIAVTPDDTYAYLGWGKPLPIEKANYPTAGQTVQNQGNITTWMAYWEQYGYKFPKGVTGTPDDSNILLNVYVDGLHCTAECNGMSVTTQLFPDVAAANYFQTFRSGLPWTPDQGSIHELQPHLSITGCNLSIYNQGNTTLSDGNVGAYWYGDKFATINSVEWNTYTPTDDSSYLTKINTAPTSATLNSHPAIYKPGYWYSGGAHAFDIQEVGSNTEGLITKPKSTTWDQTYTFQHNNPGKNLVSFPNGSQSIFRNMFYTTSRQNTFYSRQSEDAAWEKRTAFSELSHVVPKFLASSNTTDQATWDAYQWGKKYTTIYSMDTLGENHTGHGVLQRGFWKSPASVSTLW